MANEEQVALVTQGAGPWNAWRAERADGPVDLSGGALRGLDLAGADLSGADLTGADLRGTDLSGTNLTGADLTGANLFKARVDGARLAGADLRGAQFLDCFQLEATDGWQSARRDEDLACGAPIPEG
ncbi:MAG: pentapeptide repeat-containing protein [Rhodospirillales bacterium]